MRILITAGPTREPIDPVRYISNRSSGRMGMSLISAARAARHDVTAILGPISLSAPVDARRLDVETAAQMHRAVIEEFPQHDLLIMAAAVADFRPAAVRDQKLQREGRLLIECEPTQDIVAAAGAIKRSDQRTVGFSLESAGGVRRAHQKMLSKQLDLIVYNPLTTMESVSVESVLLWSDGREESLSSRTKSDFAQILIARSEGLFP